MLAHVHDPVQTPEVHSRLEEHGLPGNFVHTPSKHVVPSLQSAAEEHRWLALVHVPPTHSPLQQSDDDEQHANAAPQQSGYSVASGQVPQEPQSELCVQWTGIGAGPRHGPIDGEASLEPSSVEASSMDAAPVVASSLVASTEDPSGDTGPAPSVGLASSVASG